MLCHAEICRWGKGLLRDSNLPSIYRRPAGAAFGGGPGGEPPLGSANPKAPSPDCGLQNTFPRGLKYFGWLARRGGGFWLGGVPKGKWMGSDASNSRLFKEGFGGSRGALPPCRGPGTTSPGKGVWERSGRAFTLASSTRRRQSLGCANRIRRLAAAQLDPGGRPTVQGAFPWSVPPLNKILNPG